MPPLLSTLLYLILLLLIPVKVIFGFLSVKGTKNVPAAKFRNLVTILSSISIFFSIYYLILNSAGIKGSLMLKSWGVLHHSVACILFLSNIVLDGSLLLYTAGPENMKLVTYVLLFVTSAIYILFWMTYILYAVSLGRVLRQKLAADLNKLPDSTTS